MRNLGLRLGLGVGCLVLVVMGSPAAGPPSASAGKDGTARADLALARQIDERIAEVLAARDVKPAPRANDAEFVRRVYLDLAGRIPRVSEVRAFLDDKRPDKRMHLVEQLLDGPNYVNHFTNVWRARLLPQNNNQQVQFLAPQIEQWVRARVRDNVPYNKMVRELLTAQVNFGGPFMGRVPPGGTDVGAVAFYQANELKPENLAASTSRLFLGVSLECAQCHDHPFAQWTRKQFWEYTAFFSGIRPVNPEAGVFGGANDDTKKHEAQIPGTERKVTARFLDGTNPNWSGDPAARPILADWVTRGDNPFFARAAANRLWEHLFGVGLVDPVDDFRDDNPCSHPELLNDLARALVAHKFDLKFMLRAITASETYQRSSIRTDPHQEDPRLFARMALKGLTPEQIFDSLATATGYRENGAFAARGFNPFGGGTPRAEFLLRFANPVDKRTESQTSILQALALMNGKFIADLTSLERSETLAAVLDSPFMDHKQKLDTLYLAALGRPMRPSEISRLVPYVEHGGPSRDSKKALADVFWVLLNSSEFILNH
jgi:hypothetical protein